jgi:hypothetical protein
VPSLSQRWRCAMRDLGVMVEIDNGLEQNITHYGHLYPIDKNMRVKYSHRL